MPHCLLLPQRLFIVKTHVGIILFVIDFRIVDADSSNCDFTIRFLIRVHGLLPGSFNPSSVIVLVRNLDTSQCLFLFSFFNIWTNYWTGEPTDQWKTYKPANEPINEQQAKQSLNYKLTTWTTQTTNKNRNTPTNTTTKDISMLRFQSCVLIFLYYGL